jgi:GTP-binding protein EngB required for normal cell division
MKQSRERDTVMPAAKKGTIGSFEEITAVNAEEKKQTKHVPKEGGLTMETKTGFADFDPMYLSGNAFKLMRYSLDTTFDNITKIQEFYDKTVKDMIKTNMHIQTEAEKVVDALSESGKKGWDEYKKIIEKGFKQTEGLVQPAK